MSPGYGAIIQTEDSWHCALGSKSRQSKTADDQLGGLNASSRDDDLSSCFVPNKYGRLEDGILMYEAGAGPHHLGKIKGKCPADPYHTVKGTKLNVSSSEEAKAVKSVGDCCELCHSVALCGGWTLKMPLVSTPENPAKWTCSLIADDGKIGRAYCRDCFSGVITRNGYSDVPNEIMDSIAV